MMPSTLTEREEQLFASLVNNPNDDTFRGVLYRDGVPRPDVYLTQRVRVLFVLRGCVRAGRSWCSFAIPPIRTMGSVIR